MEKREQCYKTVVGRARDLEPERRKRESVNGMRGVWNGHKQQSSETFICREHIRATGVGDALGLYEGSTPMEGSHYGRGASVGNAMPSLKKRGRSICQQPWRVKSPPESSWPRAPYLRSRGGLCEEVSSRAAMFPTFEHGASQAVVEPSPVVPFAWKIMSPNEADDKQTHPCICFRLVTT